MSGVLTRLLPFFLVCGCGFRGIENQYDLATGADLAGVDFAGVDLTFASDLARAQDLAGIGGNGPGPLGALPPSYCCNSNEECRSRACVSTGGGPKYCTDVCDTDAVCNVWGGAFVCDPGGECVPANASYSCVPADQYSYGTKPLGSCCAHGFPEAGQECLGGLCEATGNDANPFYCTQGCNANTRCPSGYTCAAGFCWIEQSFTDPSFIYSCS